MRLVRTIPTCVSYKSRDLYVTHVGITWASVVKHCGEIRNLEHEFRVPGGDMGYSNDNNHAWGIRIGGGLQGKVPGTDMIYEKAHEWVQVACVYVSFLSQSL